MNEYAIDIGLIVLIITACLVAIPCALLGTYLVLRKTVMIGDAISHAVLPGIAIAYLVTLSFDSWFMILGASIMGFFTTFLVEFLSKNGRLQADAAIGVTFTGLFALGVILISVYLSDTDLDQDCVLYGDISDIPNLMEGNNKIPPTVYKLSILNISTLLFVIVFYKQLFITTFDPQFASSTGISANKWHYILMGMVSITTVTAFDAVGAILVVGFLVLPAATAYLLTEKLNKMLWLSVGFGVSGSILGCLFAEYVLDTSTAAAIILMIGIQFALVFVLSPTQGIFKHVFKKAKTKKLSH